jgi:photosystem II stability/assembly factor-like uncharacterized protein
MEVHPENSDVVYAGFASGGIWRTTDSGSTWTPLDDFLPTLAIGAIEIDVNNPDRIWMGTGEGWGNIDAVHGVGLLLSTDGGETWELTSLNYDISNGRDIYEIEHNPVTGTLLVGADNGLWRSTDDGLTWYQVRTSGHWKDVELKKGSTSTVFACAHGLADAGFHISTDDGETWSLVTNGTPAPNSGLGNMRFALTESDPNIIYWAISRPNGQMKGIWKSTDGGNSFTEHFSSANHYGSQGWYDLTISVDPEDANRVWSGGVYFYKSTNGGSTFQQFAGNVHVDHHATFWDPSNPDIMWVGTDGGVYRSSNSGDSFIGRNIGLPTLQYYAMNQCESLETRALGGSQDNGTWVYNNSQNHSFVLGGDGFQCECDRNDPNYVYAEIQFGDHHRSSNGGPGMNDINNGITEAGPWETPTHMDYGNPYILYTAHATTIYKTTNRGTFWTPVHSPMNGSGVSIHQSRNHPEVLVVVTSNYVWVSTDQGSTWENRTNNLTAGGRIRDVHVHPDDPEVFLVALGTYSPSYNQVWKTTDQGQNWFPIDQNLPDEPINSIEIDPSNTDWYFAGSDLAVYASFNAGSSWMPLNVGLPHVVVDDLRIHNPGRFIRVGTHGRGMWELDISNLGPSAVDSDEVMIQPLTLRVLGNPAASHATLHFGIREAGQIHLGLYDVSGRLVRTLADRFAQAVVDNVDVDLTELPAGVYLARLDANGASVSKKLVVQH